MHHSIDRLTLLPIQSKDPIQEGNIEYATLVESQAFFDLALGEHVGEDGFYPLENVGEAVGEIVDDYNIGVCLLNNVDDGVGADEAESAGHQQILECAHYKLKNMVPYKLYGAI